MEVSSSPEGRMLNKAEKPLLDEETNRRVCMAVINGIASFPQSDQSTDIIADMIMRSFDENHTGKAMRPKDLALMTPEPWCADQINMIHERFGIKRRVSFDEIEAFMNRFAREGLKAVQRTVRGEKWVLPLNLYRPIEKSSFNGSVKSIDWKVATDLDKYLTDHPKVREQVSNKIRKKADVLRGAGAVQRQNLKGRQGITSHL